MLPQKVVTPIIRGVKPTILPLKEKGETLRPLSALINEEYCRTVDYESRECPNLTPEYDV